MKVDEGLKTELLDELRGALEGYLEEEHLRGLQEPFREGFYAGVKSTLRASGLFTVEELDEFEADIREKVEDEKERKDFEELNEWEAKNRGKMIDETGDNEEEGQYE